MSSKRWFMDRNDGRGLTGETHQVGGGSKTPEKAQQLRQRMRAQQLKGSSASFAVREGRKS